MSVALPKKKRKILLGSLAKFLGRAFHCLKQSKKNPHVHCRVEFKPHNFLQRPDRILWVIKTVVEEYLVNIIQIFPKAVSKVKHAKNERQSITLVQKLGDVGNNISIE